MNNMYEEPEPIQSDKGWLTKFPEKTPLPDISEPESEFERLDRRGRQIIQMSEKYIQLMEQFLKQLTKNTEELSEISRKLEKMGEKSDG